VTDLQLFLQKISHNSINLYQILTKIGTEMCCNKPFICTKFQLDWSVHLHFMAKNTKYKMKNNKMEKKLKQKLKLLAHILELAGVICFKFGM